MTSVIKVFLASPSDVDSEREIVRMRAEQFNTNWSDEFGIHLRVIGWENIPPTAQRAQERINADAGTCELFIGLLAAHWGSDSGEFSSGFEEEFTMANMCRKETGVPDIALFFKHIDPSRASDPGPQLTRVLEFKKAIIESKAFFFKEFATDEELANFVDAKFAEFARNRRASTSPILPTATSAGQTAIGGQLSPNIDPAAITEVLDGLSKAGTDDGTKVLDFWGRLRLWLYAQATYADRVGTLTLGIHDANLIYLRRADWRLTSREEWMVIRSMLSDTSQYSPGWYWLGKSGLSNARLLLSYLVIYDNAGKTGAANILANDDVVDLDSADLYSTILDSQTSTGICILLGRVGTVEHLPVLEKVKAEVGAARLGQVETAEFLIRQRAGTAFTPRDLANYFAHGVGVAKAALLQALATTDEAEIREVIDRIQDPAQRGLLALELAKAALLPLTLAQSFLSDGDQRVKEAAVRSLIANGRSFTRSELGDIFPETRQKGKNSILALALLGGVDVSSLVQEGLRLLSPSNLKQLAGFFELDGVEAFSILGELHWGEVLPDIERYLDTDFQAFITESDEKYKSEGGLSPLGIWSSRGTDGLEYRRSQFIATALRAVRKAGHPRAIEWATKYSAQKYEPKVREEAFTILHALNFSINYPAILERFVDYSSAFATDVLPSIMANSGVTAQTIEAAACHQSPDVRRGLSDWVCENWHDSYSSMFEALLSSEADNTRKIAAHVLVRSIDESLQKSLLDRYLGLPRYYYDVVTLFDIALYAVAPYRSALLEKAPI